MCRCTGYGPIAYAFKTFAKDADQSLLDKLCDLEDLEFINPCALKCTKKCTHKNRCLKGVIKANYGNNKDVETGEQEHDFIHISDEEMMVMDAGKHKWYKAYNLSDVFKAMSVGDYKLIAGNTGQGVLHVTEYPTNVIDIFNVGELKGHTIDVNLILGAGMPLSEMMELFLQLSAEKEKFSYLKQFYDHMDLVAHIPVRNLYLSTATGEPSFCLATVFLHAVHAAIHSARLDAGYEDKWFDLGLINMMVTTQYLKICL